MILRFAVILFDSSIVEEEGWEKWREDINDQDLGKGDALVALNDYLNWMQAAETDEEDE